MGRCIFKGDKLKAKEQKEFIKNYNKSGDLEKISMVKNLFYKWTKDFEKSYRKTAGELQGVMQNNAASWRMIYTGLDSLSCGSYFTDYAFVEFFYQQVEKINDGLYSKAVINNFIEIMGHDPAIARMESDNFKVIPFGRVERSNKRTAILNANFNQYLHNKPKLTKGMFIQ